jgi:hypothetical protein
MKNWDPLSIFKYLTGAPTMHLVMLINYWYTDSLQKTDANAAHFDDKSALIDRMWMAHKYAALAFCLFETGLIELVFQIPPSIVVPSVSLFIQILCYQGLVFEQLNFFMYKQLPFMQTVGEKGFFADFDRWDILIMLDIILFLSNLIAVVIFCMGSVYPGEYIKSGFRFLEEDEVSDETK